jgi:hypothetical protein
MFGTKHNDEPGYFERDRGRQIAKYLSRLDHRAPKSDGNILAISVAALGRLECEKSEGGLANKWTCPKQA